MTTARPQEQTNVPPAITRTLQFYPSIVILLSEPQNHKVTPIKETVNSSTTIMTKYHWVTFSIQNMAAVVQQLEKAREPEEYQQPNAWHGKKHARADAGLATPRTDQTRDSFYSSDVQTDRGSSVCKIVHACSRAPKTSTNRITEVLRWAGRARSVSDYGIQFPYLRTAVHASPPPVDTYSCRRNGTSHSITLVNHRG